MGGADRPQRSRDFAIELRPAPAPQSRESVSKGEQTRRAVLGAAIARFGREGYRTTSVADIARDAGVGGTVPYAYFPNKEALFLAAIDEDAAGLIAEVVPTAVTESIPDWPQQLIAAAVVALERRPLARRVLAGLEPEVTARVLDIPALAQLRKTTAELLRSDQAAGRARDDIDPVATASGVVTIMLSLLMSVVQVGTTVAEEYGDGVAAVLAAAMGGPTTGGPLTGGPLTGGPTTGGPTTGGPTTGDPADGNSPTPT